MMYAVTRLWGRNLKVIGGETKGGWEKLPRKTVCLTVGFERKTNTVDIFGKVRSNGKEIHLMRETHPDGIHSFNISNNDGIWENIRWFRVSVV